MSVWVLRLYEPEQPAREVVFSKSVTLGRHPDNDCVLRDTTVSGHHARIVLGEDGSYRVEDLGSANKTGVAGQASLTHGESCSLSPGMILFLGSTRVEILGPDRASAGDPGRRTEVLTDAPEGDRIERAAFDPEHSTVVPGVPASPPQDDEPNTVTLPPTWQHDETLDAQHDIEPIPREIAGKTTRDLTDEDQPSRPTRDLRGTSGSVSPGAFGPTGRMDQERFHSCRSRLVIGDPKERKVLFIDRTEFALGRSAEADGILRNDGISHVHAVVRFDGQRFWLEDRDSRNGTSVDGVVLGPGQPRSLVPESFVRLGPVSALFVTECDAEGRPIGDELYETAAGLLCEDGVVSRKDVSRADRVARAESSHVGEVLILRGQVKVEQWATAFQRARSGVRSRGSNRMLVALVTLLCVVVALLLFFVLTR